MRPREVEAGAQVGRLPAACRPFRPKAQSFACLAKLGVGVEAVALDDVGVDRTGDQPRTVLGR
jgi:hypothetical protein